MPSPKKADPAHPTHGQNSGSASPSTTDIFQQFSRQLDLIHPANKHADVDSLPTDLPAKAAQSEDTGAPHDWEHEDTVQAMINSLLSGTFDENLAVHAENLAERLIERQRELDRRESQVNLRSAELENKLRQSRLDSVPLQEASEIEKTIEAELSVYHQTQSANATVANQAHDSNQQPFAKTARGASIAVDDQDQVDDQENIVTHRLDKFSESQRAPYSLLNKRWKKYIADSKAEHSLKVHQPPAQPPVANSDQRASFNKEQQTALNELTRRATTIRQRGEEVEKMYEQLHGMFAEMLRQQTSLRKVIKTLEADGRKLNRSELEAAKTSLDRLTVRLSKVGKEHFLLPVQPADAA